MTSKDFSLSEGFRRYFRVGLATTEQQKQEVYGIRYRVYCEEFCYESADDFPEHQEKDNFDQRALHCLITHKGSGRAAGCVRVVPAIGSSGAAGLPMETYCSESLHRGFIDSLSVERSELCEISRLAVDSAFRRRAGEERTRYGELDAIDCSHAEKRTFSLISVAAFLSAAALCELTGWNHAFAMMEPFLPRLLKKSGIHFLKVGRDIDYHGMRAPYYATTEDALPGMKMDLKDLYEPIYEDIKQDYYRWLVGLEGSKNQVPKLSK